MSQVTTQITKSYLAHRRYVGIMGILLPFLCLSSCLLTPDKPDSWCKSMSATYYTSPVLVMGLAIVASFLFTYRGYDQSDRIVNRASAISALIVAIFPCSVDWLTSNTHVGMFYLPIDISNCIHCIAAAILFGSFVVNILINFTKGNDKQRNQIYVIVGTLMISITIWFVIAMIYKDANVFLYETAMLILFGSAWLVKGKFLKKSV